MGVGQRRPGLPALVHDHVHVARAGVGSHPLAPHPHRRGQAIGPEIQQRRHRLGPVHHHLVRSAGRPGGEQVRLAAPALQRLGLVGLAGRQGGELVRHHPHPPARASRAAPPSGRSGEDLRAACGPRGPRGTGLPRGRSAGRGSACSQAPGRSPRSPATITRSPEIGSIRAQASRRLHRHVLDALLEEDLALGLVARPLVQSPARRPARAGASVSAPGRGAPRSRPRSRIAAPIPLPAQARARPPSAPGARDRRPPARGRCRPGARPRMATHVQRLGDRGRPGRPSGLTPCSSQNTRRRSPRAASSSSLVRASRTSSATDGAFSERNARCPATSFSSRRVARPA